MNFQCVTLYTFAVVGLLVFKSISIEAQVSYVFLPGSSSISETTLVSTTIYSVVPLGGDEPYTCSVSNQNPDNAVRQFDFSGLNLQTTRQFDYETTTQYILTIECEDDSAVTGTSSFTVNILDINDEDPVISGPLVTNIDEEVSIGTVIPGLFTVTDSDTDDVLKYSFIGIDTGYFQVDSSSGTVSVKTRLDRDSPSARVVFNQLTLVVTDSVGATATASLTITLDDINDNTPTFSPSLYYLTVTENSPSGQTVLSVYCTDVDESPGNGDITYSLVSGDDNPPKFNLSANNLLTTTTPVDYDVLSAQGFLYQLIVTATDGGVTTNTGTATVFVQVLGENDEDPVWGSYTPSYVNSTSPYDIREDVSIGTTVLTILASDADQGEDGLISYSLDSITDDDGSSEDGVFKVDSVTGALTTNIQLDRDSTSAAFYDVLVIARDGGSPSRSVDRLIRITILDVNDNPPTFTSSLYEININEKLPVSASVLTLSATDNDLTSSLSYSITSGNADSKFQISGGNILQIQSVIDLDPPISHPDYYSLVVTVVDGGTVELTGSTTVIITVTPTNDFSPVFTSSSHNITVSLSEDTSAGSSLTTVSALDGDFGVDGVIMYSVSSGDPEGYFQVTSDSGVLSVGKLIDYDTLSINPLEVVLTAMDSGGNTDSATVTVSVLDINDHNPVCSNNAIYAAVLENLAIGSDVRLTPLPVVSLSCSDLDVSDTLTYVITSGNSGFIFSVNSSGVVKLINSLDYESGMLSYNLVIEVSDGLETESVWLTVHVLAVNEASPVFSQGELTVSWPEDTTVGTVLTTVSATDLDTGVHGKITYTITSASPDVTGIMSLDASAGDIILLHSLDYDVMMAPHSYTLNITAQDGGGLQESLIVTVIVTNVNDNSPVCSPSYRIVIRPENTVVDIYPMTVLTSLGCTDADGDTLSHILSPNPYGTLFTLEETTGQLNITDVLDFETLNVFPLLLTVSDSGSPVAKTSSVEVVISLTNVNDGPPVFSSVLSVVLAEAAVVGAFIMDATADDPDSPDSPEGRLLYSILSGDSDDQFTLNRETGTLTVKKELDMETKQFYLLQIEAEEESGTYSATTTLNITLSDMNDHAPDCTKLTYSVFVSEQSPPGHPILLFSCTDSDYSALFSTVTYSISAGDWTKFEIKGSNLTLLAILDYEQGTTVYDLLISAGDGLNTQDIQVSVTLLPFNEFSPTFQNSGFSVLEDTASGTVVHQVTAIDSDDGEDGHVSFTMENHQKFGLDDKTGNITLIDHLDWETETNYTLLITAYDLGSPSLSTTATITVGVINVEDNTPIFSPSAYSLSVPENTAIGTTVSSLTCSDVDVGSDITYSIVSGDPDNVFRVEKYIPTNECKLIINNNTLLDYEVSLFFQLVVRGSDVSGLHSDAEVYIQITGVNDFSPVFTSVSSSEEYLFENSTLGSTVVIVSASDMDIGLDGNISYSMIFYDKFSLDPITGVVTVSGNLDRETKALYLLDLLAIDSGNVPSSKTATYSLTVHVEDVNDMAPWCSKAVYYINTPESTASSTLLSQLICSDTDSDSPNNQLSYQLTNTSTTFDIDSVTGQLYLASGSSFDREAVNNYTLSVQVSDMGLPELSIIVTVHIDITDENDNSPLFCCSPYTVSISEDSPTSQAIIQITATDADSPPLGTIFYRIDLGNAGDKFVIGESTGTVRISGSLKTGIETVFNLTITASDSGSPSLSSSAILVIHTIVDHVPSCPSLFYYTNILENVTVPYVLLNVSCSDVDDPVSYTLVPSNIPFSVSSTSGLVSVSSALDSEAESSYTFAVTVTAGEVVRNITIAIDILDVNEASPVFDPGGVYYISISEDTRIGTTITVINTTDPDVTSNSYYYITGGDLDNVFRINYLRGAIMVNRTMDYESVSSYVLEITVMDGNSVDALSASTSLTVSLVDVNDNPPVCSPDVFKFNISETQTGSVVTLSCTDQDPDYSTFLYSILSGNVNGDWIVDGVTGELSVNSTLDFEKMSSYSILVDVSDGTFHSDVNVFISIEDYNEYSPVFYSLFYAVNISEDLAVGSTIVTVQASDNDTADSSKLIYSIEGGNGEDKFILNPLTGILELTSVLDRETTAFYNLTVEACDRAEGLAEGKCSQTFISVSVVDVNDNYPSFSSDHYFVSLLETIGLGSSLLSVTVADADEGVNAALTLDIVAGNDDNMFTLNGSALHLGPTKQLDYETKLSHSLIIRTVDGGSAVKSSSAVVTVIVLAVNEYIPTFSTNSSVTIPEDTVIGTVIFTVTASDDDTGLDGVVVFSITSGNDPSTPFFIDALSGQIQVWSELDFDEESPSYSLVIAARDNGGAVSGLFSSMTLTVQLTDINDITPTFSQNPFYFTINEHLANGSFIGHVTANDSDSGSNGQIEYSLISGDDVVVINKSTGELTTKESPVLDFEHEHRHIIVVRVRDFGTPSLSAECLVYLTVLDTNDKSPLFTPSDYTVYVLENSPVSFSITQLTAVDHDTASGGGHFTYSISPTTHFAADGVTGIISLSSPLDYETQPMHVLMVEATDQGTSQLTGTGTVTVVVRDYNDHTPVIIGVYDKSILEDTPILTSVFTVTATDADVEENAELWFNITSGGSNSDFEIDELSGLVLVANSLDRERQSVYYPVVIVQDKGQPARSSSATVSITILDVNDVSPSFFAEQYYMDVREDVSVGTIVGPVLVYDNDTGVNAVMQFQLMHFTLGPSHFLVDQTTGNILTSSLLDRESIDSYVLICRVLDSGIPQLYNDISVNISVTDANDHSPAFEFPLYLWTLIDDSVVGENPLIVNITDGDIDINAVIALSFDLTTPNGTQADSLFSTNNFIPQLQTKVIIDMETLEPFSFVLYAVDGGTPALTGSTSVTVRVLDLNENSPVFDRDYISEEVAYDGQFTTLITTVIATDSDLGEAGQVTYYIVPSFNFFLFSMSAESGEVHLRDKIDSNMTYILYIGALDSGVPQGHSATYLPVRVDSFDPSLFMVSIFLGVSKTYINDSVDSFEESISEIYHIKYPTAKARVWFLEEREEYAVDSSPARRRRTIPAGERAVTVHLYVLMSNDTDSISNYYTQKRFLPAFETLSFLLAPDLSPVLSGTLWANYSIVKIELYQHVEESVSDISVAVICSVMGGVLFIILIVVGIRIYQKRTNPFQPRRYRRRTRKVKKRQQLLPLTHRNPKRRQVSYQTLRRDVQPRTPEKTATRVDPVSGHLFEYDKRSQKVRWLSSGAGKPMTVQTLQAAHKKRKSTDNSKLAFDQF